MNTSRKIEEEEIIFNYAHEASIILFKIRQIFYKKIER